MKEEVPRSPCVSICVLDENDICAGCYRSATEIADWFMATPQRKRAVLERARARRERATTTRLG